jgi:uncharacterized repeat protein (TIGR01451 family)
MRVGRACILGAVAAAMLIAAPVAHADRAFSVRFTTNDFGSITFAANTLMTCPDSAPTCANARLGNEPGSLGNNNGYAMTYVDVDGPANATFDSSTATLGLPSDAFVLFAGLYWAGDTSAGGKVGTVSGTAAPTPAARNTVLFRAPGAATYSTVTASTLDSSGTRFSGFADVTTAVRDAGPGAYTVANVQSGTGSDRYGSWDLVVAYRDATQPARNLTIFDGLATVSQSSPLATMSLSGFTTPVAGPVRSVVGLISSEGDRTSTGDSASLNARALSDDLNPVDNVFNSSISQLGVRFSAKSPDYANQLGSDANSFAADGYLANGATSATIRLTTGGETYYPSVVFFTTDIYSPDIKPAKSVVDLDGGAPERGDTLEYTVRLTNTGQDAATGLRFFDPIPAHATYVPGSLAVTPVAAGTTCPAFGPALTDAAGDDQAEFEGAANRAVYRIGTGASADQSGRLDPGQTVCLRLRVTIDADAPLGAQVVNQGAANFFGATLGTPFPNVLSNEAAVTVSGADLTLTKAHAGGTFVAGQANDFTLGVSNAGDIATDGSTVTVTDDFPAAAFSSVNTASGTGWTCGIAVRTVTCTRSDTLAAGESWPAITVNATVANPAPATIVNTAEVTGGGDVDPTNSSATDAGGAVAQADLALTKVSDVTTSPARRDVTFTLQATNRGPSTASAVSLTDTLAPNFDALDVTTTHGTCTTAVACDLGTLLPGEVATVTIVARVLDGAASSTATNTATVTDTGGSADPVPGNDSASVDIVVPPSSDLQLKKTVSPAEPQAGDLVTFTIPVTNAGPSVADNVIVSDAIPPEIVLSPLPIGTIDGGSCDFNAVSRLIRCERPSLAVGDTAVMTVQGILASNSRGRTVLNSVQAISDSVDPQPELAKDTVAFVPIPAVDLELSKVALDAPARPGGTAHFALRVANHGPSDAPDVVVHDTLPAGLTFVSDTRGACTAAGADVTCLLGELADGASIDDWVMEVQVDPSVAGQTVRNVATIDSEPSDPLLKPTERIASSNDDGADLAVAPLPPASPPPASAPAAAPSLAPECLANVLRLVDVAAGPSRVRLAGETAKANAGRTVTLLFRGQRVGTATVRSDGTFTAEVPLPARGLRSTNLARYQAVLGSLRSLNLKLARRMRATELSSRGGRVTIAGVVTSPLAHPVATVTLRQYRDCRGQGYTVVKRNIKVSSNGRFRATVTAPSGFDVVYYRAVTQVRKTTRNPKTYPTFTLIRGVTIQRGGARLGSPPAPTAKRLVGLGTR